jgi:hypothetical protein
MIFQNIIYLSLPFVCTAWTTPHCQDVLNNEIAAAADCWVGSIHDPCKGFQTGCTPDGMLVKCDGDPATKSMIWASNCGHPGSCHCVDGVSKCAEPPACWVGSIHSPCNGFQTGCTPDGMLVKCDGDPATASMIWASNCGHPGSCHCVDGVSKCAEPPACWVGNIHSPCNGFQTGCTPDGMLVKCDGDPATASMIWASGCGPTGSGSCHCVDGVSKC